MSSPSSAAAAAAASAAQAPSPKQQQQQSNSSNKKDRSSRKKQLLMTQTTGVLDFLQKSLSRASLLSLYATPHKRGCFVCRAVFQRQLSGPAQQVVLRLLCTGGAFSRTSITQVWIRKANVAERVLVELQKWAILAVAADEEDNNNDKDSSDLDEVRLTPEFMQGMQESLSTLDASPWTPLTLAQIDALQQQEGLAGGGGGGGGEVSTTSSSTTTPAVSPEDLERYVQSQWDAVLHFLVGTVDSSIKEPPPAVVHFLLETGLMQNDPDYAANDDKAPLVITNKGYEFMLQDNVQQVWHFCVQYLLSLSALKHRGNELLQEALLLLISLSFGRVGQAYLGSVVTKDARVMIKDLALFGLLYTRKIGKHTIFYPTRLAMQLVSSYNSNNTNDDATSSSSSTPQSAQWSLSSKALEQALAHPRPHDSSHLAIIVQTNFQLCAYTTSELHVSMLALFCDVATIRRLPNIVFMSITRDSVKSAFQLGIQARQILRFLEKHAHPRLRVANANNAGNSTTGSSVPSNVTDQIWLWDRERARVVFTPVYKHECVLPGEFKAVQSYAQKEHSKGSSTKKAAASLAYADERRQLLLLDYRQVERVEHFARQWRAREATRQHTTTSNTTKTSAGDDAMEE